MLILFIYLFKKSKDDLLLILLIDFTGTLNIVHHARYLNFMK